MFSNSQILMLVTMLVCVLIILLLALVIVIAVQSRKKKNTGQGGVVTASDIDSSVDTRNAVINNIISPDGCNPRPYSYFVIQDGGHDIYVRCFTINALPKVTKFATTFRPLFTFPHVHTTVFVKPETEDRTKRKIDHQITILDGEQSTAQKRRDRNRYRSLQGQIEDAERWVSRIEEGYDKYFGVQFLFILMEPSVAELNSASDAFYRLAKKKTIEIAATYACHPESFLSGAPYGKPMGGINIDIKQGLLKVSNKTPLKVHYMSRGSVADIFNHINSGLRHKNGVPLGRTFDNRPVMFDPFSETHVNGYGIIFAGKTGSGKTTAVKSTAKRLHNTTKGYRFAIIDSQRRGNRGEYSSLADDLNGICHQLKHNSDKIINLCEVSDQLEYDEVLKVEYRQLHLAERESVIVDNLMSIIQDGKPEAEFDVVTYMERELRDILDELFAEHGIFDNDVESLYTMKERVDEETGNLVSVRCKKDLPTITEIYKKVMCRNVGDDRTKIRALNLILAALKDYVRLIVYIDSPDGIQFLNEQDYLSGRITSNVASYKGAQYTVKMLYGNRNYFDGQSTVEFSTDCACTVFDISSLPENERRVAREITMSFITEEFSKNNSMNFNPSSSDKLVVILDENQENYRFSYMRKAIDDAYRTNRKRHVSTWISQQALSDGAEHTEIEKGVLANTAVMFLFKQPNSDKKFLAEHTVLNERQIEDVVAIGMPANLSEDPDEARTEIRNHMGECCLIDGGKSVFMKFDILMESEGELIASNKQTLDELYQRQLQAGTLSA